MPVEAASECLGSRRPTHYTVCYRVKFVGFPPSDGHVRCPPGSYSIYSVQVIGTACQEALEPGFRVRLELPARGLLVHRVALVMLPLFEPGQSKRFREAGALGKVRTLVTAKRRLLRDLEQAGEGASAIVVQRNVDMSPSLGFEKRVTAKRRLIYDVDDAIWMTGRQTGGHPLGALKGTARKVRWLSERAEHVIAGNAILAEHLATYSEKVTVVPSLVEPSDYLVREHVQADVVTLGWVGSPTTALYLRGIAPALERFAGQSSRGVRLLVVGGGAPRVEGMDVEERAWSPGAEQQALAETDIGLMPLDDTPWSRGKCAYKALQYMASGIPAVVDDVGISAATVDGAGYVASGTEQWVEALRALAEDAGLRSRMGAAGRRRVEEEFSPARWVPTMATILRGD